MFKKIKNQDLNFARSFIEKLNSFHTADMLTPWSNSEQEFLTRYGFDSFQNGATLQVLKEQIAFAAQPYYYLGANPTADCVMIHRGQVLLIQRAIEAVEGGKWAIPGGFVNTLAQYSEVWQAGHETPEAGALREATEETSVDLSHLGIKPWALGIFEGIGRDPRDNQLSWSQSHAFLFVIPNHIDLPAHLAGDDAQDCKWFSIDAIPQNLAFDHALILEKALACYRDLEKNPANAQSAVIQNSGSKSISTFKF